jgi:nucleotide-binding universal stress UspA family protein
VAGELSEPFRVLLPVLRDQPATALLSLADALGIAGRGRVLGLVEDAGSSSLGDPGQRRLSFLRWLAGEEYEVTALAPALPLEVRSTHDPARTVIDTAAETRANLVVAEWPGPKAPRQRVQRLLASLVGQTRLNLAMVRLAPEAARQAIAPRSILIPIRGGPNARLAVRIGAALGELAGAPTTFLHLQDRRHHPDRIRRETAAFRDLAHSFAAPGATQLEISADDPGATLQKIAADFDLVVMGTRLEARAPSRLLTAPMSRLLQALKVTAILARSSEGQAAWAAGRAAG